ncbi:arginine N-succinyltransferase [Pseudomonas sp. Fl4BN1]|uniref:arginine N-succinyltransferase n=1 Tax=Pseudomonas sp. Fl4BN1 TaxID=2697651 RepID=UPI0013776398|nr:arginine N-succinyltransferase [Pseudomonas sp. Fl4BN1]NBF11765.1 arginine N-succinyltransferase [Pseudomonas sp. Fl4BN1]
MIVRPIRVTDLPAVLALLEGSCRDLNNLSTDPERLAHRVRWAQRTFAGQVERADADYLFVLEDDDQQVIGICGLSGAIGLREPCYNYRLGLTCGSAPGLGADRQVPTLFLCNEMTGQSLLCSLFLRRDHRQGYTGRLLSTARLLFVAEHPARFGDKLVAELRGQLDSQGHSPFWDSLGRHFFKMDFHQANRLSSHGGKAFIGELMPRQPLYTCLLTAEAQAAIGQAHASTEQAVNILRDEGFNHQGCIDIFDGGPLIEAEVAKIRSVRESQTLPLMVGTPDEQAPVWLIHNRRLENCRITAAPGRVVAGSLLVDRLAAKRLQLQPGDSVRVVPLLACPSRALAQSQIHLPSSASDWRATRTALPEMLLSAKP